MTRFHHPCTLLQTIVTRNCRNIRNISKSVESNRVSLVSLVRYVFATCGDWDLKTMLPSQCATSKEGVPRAFRRWLNVKMPGIASDHLGSKTCWDFGKIYLGLYPFCALCTFWFIWSMFVGCYVNLVDLIHLGLVTGVKQYISSSGSNKRLGIEAKHHLNALARSQWEVVKLSCKIKVHHMPHLFQLATLRPCSSIQCESSRERSRIKGNGNGCVIHCKNGICMSLTS